MAVEVESICPHLPVNNALSEVHTSTGYKARLSEVLLMNKFQTVRRLNSEPRIRDIQDLQNRQQGVYILQEGSQVHDAVITKILLSGVCIVVITLRRVFWSLGVRRIVYLRGLRK